MYCQEGMACAGRGRQVFDILHFSVFHPYSLTHISRSDRFVSMFDVSKASTSLFLQVSKTRLVYSMSILGKINIAIKTAHLQTVVAIFLRCCLLLNFSSVSSLRPSKQYEEHIDVCHKSRP